MPSRDRPSQSPVRTGPASVVGVADGPGHLAGDHPRAEASMAAALPRRRPRGRRPAGRRSPRRWSRWAPPGPGLALSSSTCSATGRMFSLLGSTTTSSEPSASTASRSLGGRRVHRLAAGDQVVHAEGAEDAADALAGGHGHHAGDRGRAERGQRRPGGRVAGALADPALLLDLLGQVGDPDVPGPAGVEAASMAGPMSSVWMWQFHSPSPPDHHDRVAEPGPHLLEGGDGVVGGLEQVHDLVAQAGQRRVGLVVGGRPPDGPEASARHLGQSGGSGRGRPSITVSRASKSSR